MAMGILSKKIRHLSLTFFKEIKKLFKLLFAVEIIITYTKIVNEIIESAQGNLEKSAEKIRYAC
jgi:hypothetical protein